MKGFKKLSKMLLSSLMIAMMLGTTVFANPIDDTAMSVAGLSEDGRHFTGSSFDSDATDDTFVTSDSKSTHASYATDAREIIESSGLEITFLKGRNYIYTGKKITPAIVVRLVENGKTLVKGKDYTLSYKNNLKAADKSAKKAPTIVIKGKKNLKKTVNVYFNIVPKNIRSNQSVSAAFVPNADESKIKPVLVYNGKTLKLNKDFEIVDTIKTDKDNSVGTFSVRGKGNYQGYRAIEYVVGKAHKLSVSLPKVSRTYNGKSYYNDVVNSLIVECKDSKCALGVDYEVKALTDMTSAGTQKIMVIGKGLHYVTKTISFKINPAKVSGDATVDSKGIKSSYVYSPAGVTVANDLVVTGIDGKALVEGVDYKVTCSGNKKVTDKATWKVTFLGNYKGQKAVSSKFNIVADTLKGAEVYATNVTVAANGKVNPKVYVYKNGVAVPASQYKITVGKMVEGEFVALGNEKVTSKTTLAVEVAAKAGKNYTGVVTQTFEAAVAEGGVDIAKASVAKITDQVYTGSEVTPKVTVGTLEEGKDYSVQYLNNVNTGKATVIITGEGVNSGSKVVTFKIKAKSVK